MHLTKSDEGMPLLRQKPFKAGVEKEFKAGAEKKEFTAGASGKEELVSIAIVGGNECMERVYIDTCRKYGCRAKVYVKSSGDMTRRFGSPDMVILFTTTVSHKMKDIAMAEAKRCNAIVECCHSSSTSALKRIMEIHCGKKSAC